MDEMNKTNNTKAKLEVDGQQQKNVGTYFIFVML